MRRPPWASQGAGEQRHPLRHAGGDDHALGVAGHAAGPAEVAGQRDPQLGSAARVAVVEPGVGRVAQGAPQRGEPGGAREQRDVGAAGAEVETGRPVSGGRPRGAGGGGGGVGDERGGALAGDEVALGAELRVGVDHDAPRHAQFARERARRGQRESRRQPTRTHRVTQLLLELSPQRRAATIEADEQFELNWSYLSVANWYFSSNQ